MGESPVHVQEVVIHMDPRQLNQALLLKNEGEGQNNVACLCVCVCLGFLSPHHWTFAGFSNGGMGYLSRVCVFQAPVLFLSLWNFRGNHYDSNKLFRICVCVHFRLLLPCHCQPLLFAVYLAQEERLKNVWYLESWAVIWFLFPVSYLLSCFYTYSFCSLWLVILHFSRKFTIFFHFQILR